MLPAQNSPSHPKVSFLANKLSSAFFPKATNRYNGALSPLCICNKKYMSPTALAAQPLATKHGWKGALSPPSLELAAQRGPTLTPAHQPLSKTRCRGQGTSCGALLPLPFSKLLPNKEALVRGKPKQHFWACELYRQPIISKE